MAAWGFQGRRDMENMCCEKGKKNKVGKVGWGYGWEDKVEEKMYVELFESHVEAYYCRSFLK